MGGDHENSPTEAKAGVRAGRRDWTGRAYHQLSRLRGLVWYPNPHAVGPWDHRCKLKVPHGTHLWEGVGKVKGIYAPGYWGPSNRGCLPLLHLGVLHRVMDPGSLCRAGAGWGAGREAPPRLQPVDLVLEHLPPMHTLSHTRGLDTLDLDTLDMVSTQPALDTHTHSVGLVTSSSLPRYGL